MTYRKLYLRFLITVTLVSGVVGLLWVRESRAVAIQIPRYGEFVTGVEQSTLFLELNRFRTFGGGFHAGYSPFAPARVDEYDFVGILDISTPYMDGRLHIGRPRGYALRIPVWFLWLLLAGGGYLFMKAMERRSVSGQEKNLAAADAPGEDPIPPKGP